MIRTLDELQRKQAAFDKLLAKVSRSKDGIKVLTYDEKAIYEKLDKDLGFFWRAIPMYARDILKESMKR